MTVSALVESSAGAGAQYRLKGSLGWFWQAGQSTRWFSICSLSAMTGVKQVCIYSLQEWLSMSVKPLPSCLLSHFSYVWLFETLWTVACQGWGFSRQEYWSGLLLSSTGTQTNQGYLSSQCQMHAMAEVFSTSAQTSYSLRRIPQTVVSSSSSGSLTRGGVPTRSEPFC